MCFDMYPFFNLIERIVRITQIIIEKWDIANKNKIKQKAQVRCLVADP